MKEIERKFNNNPNRIFLLRPISAIITSSFARMFQVFLLIFCLNVPSVEAAITLVQSSNGGKYMGTSVSATFWMGAPTSGNLLIAQVSNQKSQSAPTTPTGWSVAISETNNNPGQVIYYKIADGTEGATVTISGYSTNDLLTLQIFEYSGASALDKTSSKSGTGNTISTNSITTTSAEELIIAAVCQNGGSNFLSWTNSFTAGLGFQVSGTPSLAAGYADRIVSSIGTYSTGATGSGGGAWRSQMVSFKAPKTWDGGAGTNNWGDANNWNPNGVPTSADVVLLNGANNIDVNIAGVCNNITLNNASLNLTIKSGNSLTVSGNLTLTSGTLKTEESFPSVSGTKSLSGGTVEYSGSTQTVNAEAYRHLTLSGSGTKTFAAGTTSISGNFSVTVPPPPYAPIGNYSKNYNPNYQTASVLGDITINTTTNSSNIDYNGNGDQTVLAIDYYNLTLSNSGTKFFEPEQ